MKAEQIKTACAKYSERLDELGFVPERDARAEKDRDKLNHARWMCDEIPRMANEAEQFELRDRTEKAMRWFGFLQGVLSSYDVFTVEEMKEDNR